MLRPVRFGETSLYGLENGNAWFAIVPSKKGYVNGEIDFTRTARPNGGLCNTNFNLTQDPQHYKPQGDQFLADNKTQKVRPYAPLQALETEIERTPEPTEQMVSQWAQKFRDTLIQFLTQTPKEQLVPLTDGEQQGFLDVLQNPKLEGIYKPTRNTCHDAPMLQLTLNYEPFDPSRTEGNIQVSLPRL